VSMGFLPHLYAFGFAHLVALIQIHVAGKAQGGHAVIVRLDAAAFAITELVGVSCYHRSILRPTLLAWGFPQEFK